MDGGAELGGADVEEGSGGDADGWGEDGLVDVTAGTAIDEDLVVGEDALVVVPAGEVAPVVGSDDEGELMLGIGEAKGCEGVDHVGWDGEVALEVGHADGGHALGGELRHGEAMVIGGNVGCGVLLQGIEGRDKEP